MAHTEKNRKIQNTGTNSKASNKTKLNLYEHLSKMRRNQMSQKKSVHASGETSVSKFPINPNRKVMLDIYIFVTMPYS